MKNLVRSVFLLFSFTAASMAFAGEGYDDIENAEKRAETDRVEVLEYFWFGCPHCFSFEPTINAWATSKPDYVDFVREAPPLNPGWKSHSQAFYAAQILEITEEFFEPFFNAIHVDKKSLSAPKDIAKWAGSLGIEGVDEEKFLKTMTSFAVDAKIRRAMEMAAKDGIRSVPSIIVNGKYRTSGSVAGSNEQVIEVIKKLTELEHTGS